MSVREGLLQPPTQVAGMARDQTPSTGPFYVSPEEEMRMYSGRWSDGLCECFSDLGSCLLCSTPCLWPVLVFELLGRLRRAAEARGEVFPLPFGMENPVHVVWLYAAGVAALLFVPHFGWGAAVITGRIIYEIFLRVADTYKLESASICDVPLQACCCQSCLLARLSRHVGRARGFIPPIMGFRVEAAPSPTAEEPTVIV